MSEPYFQYFDYHGEIVYLIKEEYSADNSLAVSMFTATSEPYAKVTVNVGAGSASEQTVDTNNLPDIRDWLVKNGIATDLQVEVPSGFCTYPLMSFDISKLF